MTSIYLQNNFLLFTGDYIRVVASFLTPEEMAQLIQTSKKICLFFTEKKVHRKPIALAVLHTRIELENREVSYKEYQVFRRAEIQFLETAKLSYLKIRHLDLWKSPLTDTELQEFAVRCPDLRSLNLASCAQITVTSLSLLRAFPDLHSLNLSCCRLDRVENGIPYSGIQRIPLLDKLSYLNLAHCIIYNGDLRHITQLPNLEELDLYFCRMGPRVRDSGLEGLSRAPNLKKLDLQCCEKITDIGLMHLARIVNLQSLSLAECPQITNQGLAYLAEAVNLRDLNLYNCPKIGDEGILHLHALKNLRKLNARETQVTNNVLKHLSKLNIDTFTTSGNKKYKGI